MPWKATDAMKERTKFVLEWERRLAEWQGQVNLAELCREFGVSRPTGYRWVGRYVRGGCDVRTMEERSRRPKHSPAAVPLWLEDAVVAARKDKPRWGPRKLRAWLVDRYPGREWPSPSTMSAIIKRRGLVTPRRRRRRAAVAVTQPFAGCDRPNAVWCVDFKGWFRTEDGVKVYPLTIVDAFSRYLVRCEALTEPDGSEVFRVFDSAFREHGLPDALRSDNGPPFASTGAGGLTRLNVWWLRLELRLERIEPGKPQQNGRQERFHRTLKLEVPPAATVAAQQRAFDAFRGVYNGERPHEALGQQPPATVYQCSRKRYPRRLARPDAGGHTCVTDKNGFIRWHGRRVLLTSALCGEQVSLWPLQGPKWEVCFGPITLGTLDEQRPERGLVVPPRRRRRNVATPPAGRPADTLSLAEADAAVH